MNRKNINRLAVVFVALIVAGIFMCCDFALDLTPLTKFFVIFFGAVIGLQSIPAVFLFAGMVKGIFFSTEAAINQSRSLTRGGVKL